MSMLKREWSKFKVALIFFTRLPIIYKGDIPKEFSQQCIRYFPLVGWIVGAVYFVLYSAFVFILPQQVAVILSLILLLLLTGAIHEDGFADCCDGFGGGWTRERILAIMKDSSNGTYAVVGLVFLIVLKISLLTHINLVFSPIVFLFAHVVSRLNSVVMASDLEYVTPNKSKSKDILSKRDWSNPIIATILTIPVVLLLTSQPNLLYSLLVLPIVYLFSRRYFKKKIGGYTGDCLGAMQQITEVLILLIVLALLAI